MKKIDGFVKSPSVAVRFTPQFLRALHLELFTKPSIRATLLRNHHYFRLIAFHILPIHPAEFNIILPLAPTPSPCQSGKVKVITGAIRIKIPKDLPYND